MKKIIWILLPFALTLAIVIPILIGNNVETVYAKSLVAETNVIRLKVGDEIKFPNSFITVNPENYTERLLFSVDDTTIADVNALTGDFYAKSVGACNLIVTAKKSKTETTSIKIKIEISDKILYPTAVNLNIAELEMVVNEIYQLPLEIVGEYNIKPTIETKNGCVEYDFVKNKLIANKVGTDLLTLRFPISETEFQVFEIEITVEEKLYYTEEIVIDINNNTYVVIQYFTDSSKDDCTVSITTGKDVITIGEHEYKHIIVVPLKIGSATIVVESPTSTCTFYVLVK